MWPVSSTVNALRANSLLEFRKQSGYLSQPTRYSESSGRQLRTIALSSAQRAAGSGHDDIEGKLVGEGFRVDLGALESAAKGVNTTLHELKAKKVSDIDGKAEDYGHDALAATLADFCDRWETGVEHLSKDAQEIASRLSLSVQHYLRVDDSLKGHLDGILQRPTGEDPGVH